MLHQNGVSQENRCGIQETGDLTKDKGKEDCQKDDEVGVQHTGCQSRCEQKRRL